MYKNSQTTTTLRHIIKQYKTEPEYLWPQQSPTFCVFRHHDNRKWFALVMTIPAAKLGLKTNQVTSASPKPHANHPAANQNLPLHNSSTVEILNLKFDQGQALDFANNSVGIFPAYHMNKQNWITLLLDGTLSDAQIFELIARSFRLTSHSSKIKITNFAAQVYAVVKNIPAGEVMAYGQVAALAGRPGAARAVGNILHHNPHESDIPCHRVVNSKGRLALNFAFNGPTEQKHRLEQEGVKVVGNFPNFYVVQQKSLRRP